MRLLDPLAAHPTYMAWLHGVVDCVTGDYDHGTGMKLWNESINCGSTKLLGICLTKDVKDKTFYFRLAGATSHSNAWLDSSNE